MYRLRLAFVSTLALVAVPVAAETPLDAKLSFAPQVLATPFTGRVFLIVTKKEIKSGLHPQSIYFPEPFLAQDVRDWKPGAPLKFHAEYAFPASIRKPTAGKYHVQAVMDRDLGGLNPFTSPGNLYSKAQIVTLGGNTPAKVSLILDQVVPEKQLESRGDVRWVDVPSKLLSDFHGKPMRLRAGVLLPKSYDAASERRFAIVYEVPGFSGDHTHIARAAARKATELPGIEVIHVVLDPSCRLGHHVFADSANNGPCGQALVSELIPHIEKSFRAMGTPDTRLLTGHSSGGWSSLWLQVTYPHYFGGVWSTAPDSIDFRDFQGIDIYRPKANVFYDDSKSARPLGRKGKDVWFHYKTLSDTEHAYGRSGQLGSFEAVFSPKGADGKPLPLWDRTTGEVRSDVAHAWKKYDIGLILRTNWKTLEPKLRGKLHVYMGGDDNFYLDGAVRLLEKWTREQKVGAVVEIFPGRDHGTLIDAKLRERMNREMAEAIRKSRGE